MSPFPSSLFKANFQFQFALGIFSFFYIGIFLVEKKGIGQLTFIAPCPPSSEQLFLV